MVRGISRPSFEYRLATAEDVDAIAALHADSWRRHYRGAYSDAFLDGDVFADRLALWTDRLTDAGSRENSCTIVAELVGEVVGMAHTIFDADPEYGALLDNLHVRHDLKRGGVGRRLMAETAKALAEERPGSALHLWVLEQNTAAQAFYEAMGGEQDGRKVSEAPGGGEIAAFRYVWAEPAVLLARRQ